MLYPVLMFLQLLYTYVKYSQDLLLLDLLSIVLPQKLGLKVTHIISDTLLIYLRSSVK